MAWSKYQLDIFDKFENTNSNLVVSACPGCLHPDTKVLMYNGDIKLAKDIKIGDLLMGDDSNPRTVLNVDSGVDNMYEVIPVKGESFIVNSQHILTIHHKRIARSIKQYKNTSYKSPIVDIPISYLLDNNHSKNGEYYANFKLQRYGVDFKESKLNIDPYLLGLWLAEGSKGKGSPVFSICASDNEIIDYLFKVNYEGINPKVIRDSENCLRISLTNENYSCRKNILRNEFKKCINGDEIFISKEYLISSKQQRLELLAGLIDGDGYLSNNVIEISTKFELLNNDILFLCRSLGLAAYSRLKKSTIKSTNFEGYYHKISISGDLSVIPNKLLRKKGGKRRQIKSVLRTGFKIKSLGVGSWNGFTVDGNNRFLLGDFTVTHNSGKTTTLLELLKRKKPHRKAIFLAFNKSIAEELKRRVPFGVDVSTIHSYGCKMLMRYFNGKIDIKPNKVFNLSMKFLKEWGYDKNPKKFEYLGTVSSLVDLYRLYLCNNSSDLREIADYQGVTCLNGEISNSMQLIDYLQTYNKYGPDNEDKRLIDFVDMIYLPAIYEDMQFIQYDEVMIDESQDLNVIQQIIIKKIIKKNGRFISVGDPFQSIYGFQGADSNAFKNFQNESNTITLPLSISYRCPKKVVEKANSVYNVIEANESNIDGEVREGSINEVEEGDFVLCRNNQPLAEAYIYFLTQGKKVHIKGKELGEGILRLVSKIEDKSISEGLKFLRNLLDQTYLDLKDSGIERPMNHPRYVALQEKVSIVNILIDHYFTFDKLKKALDEMFSDDVRSGIILSTIHRSKGLESDNIFILRKELIPSQYAEKDWEIEQEQNLLYVAFTRAKKKLVFITDF